MKSRLENIQVALTTGQTISIYVDLILVSFFPLVYTSYCCLLISFVKFSFCCLLRKYEIKLIDPKYCRVVSEGYTQHKYSVFFMLYYANI